MSNLSIYSSLQELTSLSETTKICMNPNSKKLYVIKKVPLECVNYYKKISAIRDSHIAKVFYVNVKEDHAEVMREYISGNCLADLIEKNTLKATTALKITHSVCLGLSKLHSVGLVHRDINPNNIIVSSDGISKIIDFGIVRSFSSYKTSDTVIMGTPGYAAPEQFGFTQSNNRTDIYAVGVMLNYMVTGEIPNVKIAEGDVGKIIKKCIQMDPENRYYNINELCSSLESLMEKYSNRDLLFARKLVTSLSMGIFITLSVLDAIIEIHKSKK